MLRQMATAMAHRGPDDSGADVVCADRQVVGLCATRLAIQDVSDRGHQPMRSEQSGTWVVLNGEIYNASPLRADLRERGHVFRSGSDTEVILAAHDEWGVEAISRLRGMFALAVWDAGKDELVIARDRLGIKPLYYHVRDHSLLFASEVRALLSAGIVPRAVSQPAVLSYLATGAVEEPYTIIDGALSIPPGHYGVWSAGQFKLSRYWSLGRAFSPLGSGPDRAEAVHLLRAHLEDAVRRHLVSDVPLGVFLSGGIDSSALVGLVSTVADEPPRTVSVVFPQQRFSEAEHMRLIAARFGTRHSEVELDDASFLRGLSGALDAMDQPTFDGVNTFVVAGAARSAGLTVALSGLGGDELFAGYDSFRTVPRLEALRRHIPSRMSTPAARAAQLVMRPSDRREKLARWLSERNAMTSAYSLQRELFGPDTRAELTRVSLPAVEYALEPDLPEDTINRISMLELEQYTRNVLLRDADVLSMAHGLEVRVPFLDHELVEFVGRLPGSMKLKGNGPKPLLVESVADLLPPSIVNRPKMGFTFPFDEWMRTDLGAEIEATLLDSRVGGPVAELLDHEAVAKVWTRFKEGHGYWSRPWSLYVLKAWGERHLV